jgi:hypothetical protein
MIMSMKRYEYRIEDLALNAKKPSAQDEQLVEALNRLGKQGWRICHVERSGDNALVKVWLERKLADWNLDNVMED